MQKRIYRDNQRHIRETTEVTDPQFAGYERRYNRAVARYQRRVRIPDVGRAMLGASVVLVGDYHTLDQSQRSFMRVLRTFAAFRRPMAVALECVVSSKQKQLDEFMRGEISEQEFARHVGFRKRWFFDLWPHYRVIFDWLKENSVSVIGIESDAHADMTLKERDVFMSQQIVSWCCQHPDATLFVLVGDLHLAPQHLRREIARCARRQGIKLPVLTLYQNSPAIYWQLSRRNVIDEIMVVKLSKNEFCRLHTPPIIAQQSYLNWLYHDEGHIDWIDAKASFIEILRQIARVIGLKLPAHHEEIDVYTCGDLSFLPHLSRRRGVSRRELSAIRRQVRHSESYFFAKAPLVYIANVSINHAAEEASHYLKFLCAGLEKPRSRADAFYANVLHEALGFFGSKLINSKRKCARAADFRREIGFLEKSGLTLARRLEAETARLFLRHEKIMIAGKFFKSNQIAMMSPAVFISLSHAIGYDLGDRLYHAFMGGKISAEKIRQIYQDPWLGDGVPARAYLAAIQPIRRLRRPEKV